MQTDLNNIKLTKIEMLKRNRMILYEEFVKDIEHHIIFLRQRTATYKDRVKDIDKEIDKENKKQKQKNC